VIDPAVGQELFDAAFSLVMKCSMWGLSIGLGVRIFLSAVD